MRIYLDLCCLKRPFDDQRQARIQIETLAIDAILQFCRDGNATLVSSRALEFENGRNPDERRRDFAARLLALAGDAVGHTPAIAGRATILHAAGIRVLDALHLASAETTGAEFFCTCDDELLAKAPAAGARIRVVSPTELMREISP